MNTAHAAARVCALALLGLACRTPLPGVPLPAHDPRPRALIAAFCEHSTERRALRASARLSVDSERDDLRLRSRQRLLVERPDRLRVELLGWLDQTAAVLVTDAGRYEFFRAEDRWYEQGEVHDGLLRDFARIDIAPEEAIGLLLGAPILDPTLDSVRARIDEAGTISVERIDELGGLRERVAFDAEGRLVRFELVDPEAGPRWSARYERYRDVGGRAVAHRLELDLETGSRAAISLADVELDPELPRGLFRLRR